MKKPSRHKSMFFREKSSWLKVILNIYAEPSLWSLQDEIILVLHGKTVILNEALKTMFSR